LENNWLWDINTAYATRAGRYKHLIENKFININIDKEFKEKIKILDIGGGSGRFAIPLSTKHNVSVIEPNITALKILKDKCSEINIVNDSFEDYDFKGQTFDVIIIMEVLQYLNNLEQVFQKLNSLLNSDGMIIFHLINLSSWKVLKSRRLKKSLYPGACRYTECIKLINKNNLSITDMVGFNWPPVKVNSNNFFVPLFAFLERILFLRKMYRFSPEILFCVKK
jgi:2-polyprenyl-3-methyl-5-hydroxy-6-metoxy-1,4-benzoquinol methylase